MNWTRFATVRARLTYWYVSAMIVVLAVYAAGVYVFVGQQSARLLDERVRSEVTSPSTDESISGAVLSRISSRRTMHRCTPGSVQSERPEVPSAHPSQTPSFRIRHAKGS